MDPTGGISRKKKKTNSKGILMIRDILIFALVISFLVCGYFSLAIAQDKSKTKRFVLMNRQYKASESYAIIIDTKTHQKYLFHTLGPDGGLIRLKGEKG